MALPKSQATGIENIHTATLACICSLEACLSVKPLMKEGWAENRLADMNLWASGVGALARPKASLDRRLEFQPKARLVLSNLLLTLERFIEVCRIHAMDANSAEIIRSRDEGTSTTLTNMPRVVDSESASSAESWFMELGRDIGMISDSSSDSYAEDQPAYCDHETKVKRSMDDIDDLIDQLIMLGFAIRKSGTAARLQKADKTFDPKQNADLRTYLESIVHRNTNPRPKDSTFNKGLSSEDRIHQADTHREVTVQQNHLIIANLRRRHRFKYARRHHLDLGQKVAQPIITKPVLSAPGPRQSQITRTPNHLGEGMDKPTMTLMGSDKPSPEVPEARGASETTASAVEGSILNFTIPSEPATSVMSTSIRKFEYPSPPPISSFMRGFKCPCCYQTLPEMFHESSRWRKHLTEDLCPYTCPFSNCERAEVLYISRTTWLHHILEAHGKGEYWECQACSGADNENIFLTAKELAQHHHVKHGSTISEDEVADLQAFCRNIVPPNISQCPLCSWPKGEEVMPDALTNLEHIGSCIHEFSLNSLPWAASLPLQGADSVTLSSPNVEEWLTGTVEKLNTEEIRDIDVTVFRPLPGQPRSPIQDPLYIPHEYFAEASKYSSQAERGSRIPSVVSTTQSHPDRPRDRRGFEIAIFCSLALEADAVEALFDRYWEDDGLPFGKEPGDPNAYCTGVIGRFNVVLVHMPAMGRFNTATVAANCGKSFPNIKLALVVGICGVVPFSPTKDEIILGDVIISDGIIQYDFGRQLPHRLVHEETLLDVLGRPNPEIRGVLAKLKVPRYRRQLSAKIKNFLDDLRQDPELHAEYPGSGSDKLFDAACRHVDNQRSCEQAGCEGKLVKRSRLSTADAPPKPMVHFGLMASGNVVMKSGEDRDRIASTDNVIAFEMEGAGVWDNFPCIIIKGGCDYADSHKNNVWHRYAAATAAACVKAFLDFWNPSLTPGNSLQAFDDPITFSSRTEEDTMFVTRRHYLPFSRNRSFVGRQRVIDQLQKLLFTESDSRHVALVGLGGMGKTQIALQLAHLMKNNEEPDQSYSVIWMPAITMEAFESECSKMICQFGVDPLPGENSKDAFKKFLCSAEAGKWFLIIDNADNFETLDGTAEAPGGIVEFIPDCEHGYILYTTRSREVAVSVAQNNVVKLSEMDDEDAKALLESSLIEKDQMEDTILIDKLLHKLAYLPLAIIQASAYMKVNEISVNEYLRLLQNTDQDMVELLSCGFLDSAHYNSSQGAVATTWIVSFKQIRALHEDAAKVLSVTAYLEPKAIPRALLPPLSSEQKMTRAIGTLCGYSFLSKREDGETFDMNSLVHLAIKRWNEEEGLEAGTRQMAFAHIAQTFPYSDWENRELWRQYMPHALRLLTSEDGANVAERSLLGEKVGLCLRIDGQTTLAVHILESVVQLDRATLVENDWDRLRREHQLALAYLSNGQTKQAIELLEHVVAVQAAILAENDPNRLISEHVLGGMYQGNGQTKQAIELLEHVVAVQAAILAENDPNRLASQHMLASAYHSNGQTEQAIELLEHVVAVQEAAILAENDPNRLISEHVLGVMYQGNGQTEEAIKLLEHVVAARAVVLSEDHPDRQLSMEELQCCYESLAEVSASEESDDCETVNGM